MNSSGRPKAWIWIGGSVVIVAVALVTKSTWLPAATWGAQQTVQVFRDGSDTNHEQVGRSHDSHQAHEDSQSLELSPQGRLNVGLTSAYIQPVQLQTYRKSMMVPAVVVKRPGRTHVQVATPMTGVVTHVRAVQGEAVEPGTLLFKIRLTHEDLVQAQTDFLRSLGELDVEEREISRLTGITTTGAVAGKIVLERQYAREKLLALLSAQRESLRLHGLSVQQVEQIAQGRRLLRELKIVTPSIDTSAGAPELRLSHVPTRRVSYQPAVPPSQGKDSLLILQTLDVHKGQSVSAGETLCVLADYGQLFVEGLAFETDLFQLRNAFENGWTVDAVFHDHRDEARTVSGLEIAYLPNQVDHESRTLKFYVRLPNVVTQDRRADGKRFVQWRYLMGQRLRLRVPVEEWKDQIVLPIEAVIQEGAEYFVFQENGSHFDRVAVHVRYKDQSSVVISNDGSLFPGDVVALRGAHQMQMALKNKAGGGVDPHAGHTH